MNDDNARDNVVTPSIRDGLDALIRGGLAAPYISESSFQGVKTGNHYQSVVLGSDETRGFRTSRADILDTIDFDGKRVLDLGSNLGEISRAVRRRGAALVDGFEADPYFVELAQAINARNKTTRVSFFERDITDPSIYTDEYDIVLGLSVFIYMREALDRIAAVTREVLILETHKLTDNLETTYLEPLSRHFAYVAYLGESEWGTNQDQGERRAILALAKDREALERALRVPVSMQALAGRTGAPRERATAIDPRRTPWLDPFFKTFAFPSADELLAAVDGVETDVDTLSRSDDLRSRVMSGWAYWFLYLKGFRQYCAAGNVEPDNIFLRYLVEYYPRNQHDAGLVEALKNEGGKRLERRYDDLRALLAGEPVDPVTIVVREHASANAKVLYEAETGSPVAAAIVDGYHRLFAGRLAGANAMRATIVSEPPSELVLLAGELRRREVRGSRLFVEGSIESGAEGVDAVELWLGDRLLARGRATVSVSDDHETARRGVSFELEAAIPNRKDGLDDLRVVATRGWSPVGELRVPGTAVVPAPT